MSLTALKPTTCTGAALLMIVSSPSLPLLPPQAHTVPSERNATRQLPPWAMRTTPLTPATSCGESSIELMPSWPQVNTRPSERNAMLESSPPAACGTALPNACAACTAKKVSRIPFPHSVELQGFAALAGNARLVLRRISLISLAGIVGFTACMRLTAPVTCAAAMLVPTTLRYALSWSALVVPPSEAVRIAVLLVDPIPPGALSAIGSPVLAYAGTLPSRNTAPAVMVFAQLPGVYWLACDDWLPAA